MGFGITARINTSKYVLGATLTMFQSRLIAGRLCKVFMKNMLDARFGEGRNMKKDDFEGSIWQALGYDRETCKKCGAHLHGRICLNGCYLSPASRFFFEAGMEKIAREMK
jgi:hypothetical protein